jgi:hypothetical protein
MLRVEFTSDTDLYKASDGGGSGLYVFTSFCPYSEDRAFYVGDTYYNDRRRYGPSRILERTVTADGKVIEKMTSDDRRPAKDATGKYVYTTYLALDAAATPSQPGRVAQIGYNLRRQPLDLCLRIDHPGYFITPSRSRVFKVPSAMIQAALLNH